MGDFKNLPELINRLVEDREVSAASLEAFFAQLCDGVPYPTEQLAALLVLLRTRGETAEQLAGLAGVLLERALPVSLPQGCFCLCGTGGDQSGTFNISTTASLLVAACGVPVAKHGSGSVTSKSGSADVLDALGIATNLGPEEVARSVRKHGFAFLLAQKYHPSFKNIAPVRKVLGVRTIFNIMGPLLHPGDVKRQVIGVFHRDLLERMAGALSLLGHVRTLVVCSEDGLDEISLTAPTHAKLVEGERVTDLIIRPEDYGFERCTMDELLGGDAGENAHIARAVLDGGSGPKADCVVLNAGVGIFLGGRAESIEGGIARAREVQQSGAALELVEALQEKA